MKKIHTEEEYSEMVIAYEEEHIPIVEDAARNINSGYDVLKPTEPDYSQLFKPAEKRVRFWK